MPDRRVTLEAPAKINLGLKVLRRREDGCHDIITRFQRVSLCDEVILEPLPGEVRYHGPALTNDPGDNLCVRAAQAFRNCFGGNLGVGVTLNKRIPVGAGLGGGSSDAAAVLRGMARLYGIREDDPELLKLGAGLGADVSFFLRGWEAAVAQGVGDRLEPVPGLSRDLRVVLLHPGFPVNTAEAYQALDRALTFDEGEINIVVCQFLKGVGRVPEGMIENDFTPHLFAAHPELAQACDRLLAAGVRCAGLTGSGSALFAVFDSGAHAGQAARGWLPPWRSIICRPA